MIYILNSRCSQSNDNCITVSSCNTKRRTINMTWNRRKNWKVRMGRRSSHLGDLKVSRSHLKRWKNITSMVQAVLHFTGTTHAKKSVCFRGVKLGEEGSWFGCFSMRGVSELAFLSGRQNSECYTQTLTNDLLPFANSMHHDGWTFQQDNASIHTSRHTNQWFKDKQNHGNGLGSKVNRPQPDWKSLGHAFQSFLPINASIPIRGWLEILYCWWMV